MQDDSKRIPYLDPDAVMALSENLRRHYRELVEELSGKLMAGFLALAALLLAAEAVGYCMARSSLDPRSVCYQFLPVALVILLVAIVAAAGYLMALYRAGKAAHVALERQEIVAVKAEQVRN
jgi:hypothetical protein